ncbi:MAG TPA: sigma-70 family RNA polymerase sigma factor, partial [Gemmatimonadaceae bacterium]
AERYQRAAPDLGVGASAAFDVEIRTETADMRAMLARAVARLPGNYREVVELVHFHGRSYSEAACVLGIRPGTVRSRLFRARILLRSELGANEPQAACA